MQRKINFSVGEFYHIYNRGTEKRDIFIDDLDRERFLKLLYVSNGITPFVFRDFPIGLSYVDFDRGKPLVAIGAYCLMPNHFHILVREVNEGGISKFTKKLGTGYSMYFNKKYSRTGSLFEGPFKAVHVNNDEYLKYLFSYIHLNPVKNLYSDWKETNILSEVEKKKKYLDSYKYSSYLDYIGIPRKEKKLLDTEKFPEYFSLKNDFNTFITEWLNLKNRYVPGGKTTT